MNKHTPGPWKIGKPLISNVKHNRGIYCNHGTPDEWMIVEVQGCGQDSECGANARLIAAAVDMLEALKMCVIDAGQPLTQKERMTRIKFAKATIQKAGGS
jgi:hypothetical protein